MRILHAVEFYHPSVGGMQEVVRQISERLASMGHDVTVATTRLEERTENVLNGVKIVGFDISGNAVRGISGDVDDYVNFVAESNFDVVTNFAAQQWTTDAVLPLLDRIKSIKVFVPTGFSGLYADEYADYFVSMKRWLHQYDMNVFLSEDYRDIIFARECGVKKLVVIPNGASEEEFLADSELNIREKLNIPDRHFLILHVGTHTGFKGHREAIDIFGKARIKDSTLLMVANHAEHGCLRRCTKRSKRFNLSPMRLFDGKKLIITELGRSETIAAYKSADLFLFPSNIECSPLVLFECMAAGLPFLTSDAGNAAEIVEWSKSGIVLPSLKSDAGLVSVDIGESAGILKKLHDNQPDCRDMGRSGFSAWQERFRWGVIASEYEKLYKRLLNMPR